jgi:hypothetical protein
MLTELLGKGGQVCQAAKDGQLRCPLIIRPTSEDVITGNLFGALRAVNPRWWLPQLLNRALGTRRFRQQVFRRLDIQLWKNRRPYPRELLPWEEGSTQVDVTITWENPPTTIFIEMKYGADLAAKTSGDNGSHGFPSDQLIRNIRVGLLECGWFQRGGLVQVPPRNFAVIVIGPTKGHPLVAAYRDPDRLRSAIPHHDRLSDLPVSPFVGEATYGEVAEVLQANLKWLSRPEQVLARDVADYLAFKVQRRPEERTKRQTQLLPRGDDAPPLRSEDTSGTPALSLT